MKKKEFIIRIDPRPANYLKMKIGNHDFFFPSVKDQPFIFAMSNTAINSFIYHVLLDSEIDKFLRINFFFFLQSSIK